MRQLPLGVRLLDRATFDSFLTGANQVTVAYLREVAAGRRGGFGWLAGPRGAGKSHLLQAVCAQFLPAGAVAYLPLSQLVPMGVELLSGWQDCRCVCVDDLETVIGRMEWERALFALYREVEENGAALLMAAKAPPTHWPFVLPDLASRCAASTVLTAQPLLESEQRDALRLRARLRGLELPEETVLYLQQRFPRDMDSLYQLLDTLDEAALEAQRRLTVPFIREVLARRPV